MYDNRSMTVTFQSTLPMRGATPTARVLHQFLPISIHTPHAGSDALSYTTFSTISEFQSTLPMRGATLFGTVLLAKRTEISIHTPHAGSDPFCLHSPQ